MHRLGRQKIERSLRDTPATEGHRAAERSRQLRQIALHEMDHQRRYAEIIERILRPKITGEPLDDEVAHLLLNADLCSGTPDELVAGRPPGLGEIEKWCFLDGRTLLRRHADGGCWRLCSLLKVAGDGGPVRQAP